MEELSMCRATLVVMGESCLPNADCALEVALASDVVVRVLIVGITMTKHF